MSRRRNKIILNDEMYKQVNSKAIKKYCIDGISYVFYYNEDFTFIPKEIGNMYTAFSPDKSEVKIIVKRKHYSKVQQTFTEETLPSFYLYWTALYKIKGSAFLAKVFPIFAVSAAIVYYADQREDSFTLNPWLFWGAIALYTSIIFVGIFTTYLCKKQMRLASDQLAEIIPESQRDEIVVSVKEDEKA